MKNKPSPGISESVYTNTVISHPGITIEKNLVSFDDAALITLTDAVEKLLLELEETPLIEGPHPQVLQRVTDTKIKEILASDSESRKKSKGFLGSVRSLLKGKSTPKETQKVLKEAVKKDTRSNSKTIYIQINGQLFGAPIIVWGNKNNLSLEDFMQELIDRMNIRARLGGNTSSKEH